MSQPLNTDEQLQEVVDAYVVCKNKTEAADSLNLPRRTYTDRLNAALKRGFTANNVAIKRNDDSLLHKIQTLETQLSSYKRDELTDKYIRSKI